MNGSGTASDEVVVERLDEHRRRERPELLAELDPRVDDVAHVGAARIGQDAAVAERAGAPLHPALKPADDAARRRSARAVQSHSAASSSQRPRRGSRAARSSPRARRSPRRSRRRRTPVPSSRATSRTRAARRRARATRGTRRRAPCRCRRPPAGCRRRGTACARGSCRWRRCSSRSRRPGTAAAFASLVGRVQHVERAPPRTPAAATPRSPRARGSSGSSGRRAGPSSASSFGVNTRPIVGSPSSQVIVDAVRPVAEVREIELEARRRREGEPADAISIDVARLAVRREAHHLELVAVLRETRGTA